MSLESDGRMQEGGLRVQAQALTGSSRSPSDAHALEADQITDEGDATTKAHAVRVP